MNYSTSKKSEWLTNLHPASRQDAISRDSEVALEGWSFGSQPSSYSLWPDVDLTFFEGN
jgi:hypothetical protein